VKIVVGLGNPGKPYEKTRHNVGWMVLDRITDRAGLGGRVRARDASAVVIGRVDGLDLVLAKPTTYMNLSGVAVRKLLARERAPKSEMLVIVDDFALPLGRLRMRGEGSAGGHNGLRSIIAELGTQDFSRLRVGIGAPARSSIDHVLSRFDPDEQKVLDAVLDAAADAVLAWARDGIDRTANRWNAWAPPADLLPLSAAEATRPGPKHGPSVPGSGQPSPADRGPGIGEAPASGDDPARAPGPGETPGPGEVGGPAGADGIRRTSTGWRRLLPAGRAGHAADRDRDRDRDSGRDPGRDGEAGR
jgi:peptidyl-tRNA hydrolase, PTH1 family